MECIKNVPVLHYPLQYGCGGHELMRFMSADSFWQKKYSLFNGNYHVGRLFPEKKYVTLLVQSLDLNSPPVIYTYKSNGRVIDSLVIASSCYEVPSGLFRSESTINKDGTIIQVDKINFFQRYKNEEIVLDTTKTIIKTSIYTLKSTGKILLLKRIEKKGK